MADTSYQSLVDGLKLPTEAKSELLRMLSDTGPTAGSVSSRLASRAERQEEEPVRDFRKEQQLDTKVGVPPVVADPDSFANSIARSYNQFQEDFFGGAEVLGRAVGSKWLQDTSKEQSQIQALEKAQYGEPTRTASITGGYEEIKKAYEEQGIGAAFDRGALLLKDMTASAIGSMAVPVGAALAAPVAAGVLGAGAAGAGVFGIAATLLASYPAAVGGIEEEAKKLGASQDNADTAAMLGGTVVAALDRLGAAGLVKHLVGALGKDAVVGELEKAVGKTAARTVLENAYKTTAETVGKGLVAGGKEAFTEGGQEIAQMSAAGVAADKGVMPYTPGETVSRIADAMALGFVGGAPVATMTNLAAARVEKETMQKAAEQRDIQDKLQQSVGENLDNLSAGGFEAITSSNKMPNWLSTLISPSLKPLRALAESSPEGNEVVTAMQNEPNQISVKTAGWLQALDDITRPIKKDVKLPFSKSVDGDTNERMLRVIRDGAVDQDEAINKAALDMKEKFFGTVELDQTTGKPKKIIKLTPKEIASSISANYPMRETVIPDFAEMKLSQLVKDGTITQADALTAMRTIEPLKKRFNEMVDSGMKPAKAMAAIRNTKDFLKAADTPVWKPKATGIFGELINSNIDVDFNPDYFTRVFKTDSKSRKALEAELTNIYGKGAAASIVDNIMGNDGYYTPDPASYISIEAPHSTKPFLGPAGFQQPRSLPEAVIRRLEKAGAVETDIQKVASKYAINASKQMVTKKLADTINYNIPELRQKGLISVPEEKRIKDVYDALSHHYSPISNKSYQEVQKWLMTSQNVLLLPLTAITSLPEFLITMSRVSPKYVAFGASNAAYNSLRRGLRKFLPKLPLRDQERAFNSIIEGLDNSIANRLGEINNVSSSKKVTDFFFKATLLDFVTRVSRDVAFQATRLQLVDDLRLVREVNQTGKKTRGSVFAQRRLLEQGIVNQLDPEIQDWASDTEGKSDPKIISQAMAKTVNEIITSPNVINRPLWMSNPYLAPVAQLKGFMTVFANNVVGRMWREVFLPLTKGRVPVGEAMKYAIMFGLLTGANMFITGLKDSIRYGDEESPTDKMDGKEQIMKAFSGTGITGLFGAVTDAANAAKYGSNFWSSLLGPLASQVANLAQASNAYVLDDKPRQLARELTKLIPMINMVPLAVDWKQNLVDEVEENLANARSKVVN